MVVVQLKTKAGLDDGGNWVADNQGGDDKGLDWGSGDWTNN